MDWRPHLHPALAGDTRNGNVYKMYLKLLCRFLFFLFSATATALQCKPPSAYYQCPSYSSAIQHYLSAIVVLSVPVLLLLLCWCCWWRTRNNCEFARCVILAVLFNFFHCQCHHQHHYNTITGLPVTGFYFSSPYNLLCAWRTLPFNRPLSTLCGSP